MAVEVEVVYKEVVRAWEHFILREEGGLTEKGM